MDQRFLGRQLIIHGAVHGQGIGDFSKGCLDGLLVLSHRDFPVHFRRLQRPPGTGVEDRHDDLRGEGPGILAGSEETRQVAARRPEDGG